MTTADRNIYPIGIQTFSKIREGGYIYDYILEFKINASSASAMRRIREREYWRPYIATGKAIYLIGVGFDTRSRRLTVPLIERP